MSAAPQLPAALNSTNSSYEVGKFYRVPCVRAQYHYVVDDWPVTGPQHEDAEFINFPYQHYHIDWRFVPQHRFKPLGFHFTVPLMTSERINQQGLPAPVLRRRKCQRQLPDFLVSKRSERLGALEAAYAQCKLKPGMICPHRGIPLVGAFQDGDVVTCPGHGLRWNVKTGELVR